MNKLTRLFSCILCILMLSLMLPFHTLAAPALDPLEPISLALHYLDKDSPIQNVRFALYRVADMDTEGNITDAAPEFCDYPLSYEKLSQEELQVYAAALKGYAQSRSVKPTAEAYTDDQGVVRFPASGSLQRGLYLVFGDETVQNDTEYITTPFLLTLPMYDSVNSQWEYHPEAACKYQSSHFTPGQKVIRKVVKVWDDVGYVSIRPEQIAVYLMRDGSVYDSQMLSSTNGWTYTWVNLEGGHDWTVMEQMNANYIPIVSQSGSVTTINNTFTPASADPPVTKKLIGDTPKTASTFTFTLHSEEETNPMPEGSNGRNKTTKIHGAGSGEFGRIYFTQPGTYVYTIREENSGETGYTYDSQVYTLTYTVVRKADSTLSVTWKITKADGTEVNAAVFTNTYTLPGEKLPQTGLTWWPVPVLFCSGMLIFVVGVMRRRAAKRYE